MAIANPVLKILHLNHTGTSWIWMTSAILGIFLGPVIGHWSDVCKAKLGMVEIFYVPYRHFLTVPYNALPVIINV